MTKGINTSEFWLAVMASVIGGALASGLVSNALALQVLGAAGTVLASLGYTAGRVMTKTAESKAKSLMAAAKIQESIREKKS
jgi:hypothetical protein